MPQPSRRFPSLLAVFAKLKTVKFLNARRLLTLSATPLGRLLESTRARQHEDITAQDFIVIISLHYRRWRGHPDGQSMQLETVKNDTKVLLDHLGYRHNSKDGRRWYFLMDYDLDYEDGSKVTKPLPRTGLPTRDNILRIIREAACNGASGLIHFSGHCNFEAPGTSELEYKTDGIIYKETEDSRQGPKVAYLVPCDGKRVYGEDIHLSLQNTSKKAGSSIITETFATSLTSTVMNRFNFIQMHQSLPSQPSVNWSVPDK
ncbi:hypothetical protein FRC00_000006 [Tulasnella sp. 408]|nr:hypothetical protein FRC00_000006 [Tulasnella sp. 408]